MRSETYREYVKSLKSQISASDLQHARQQLDRQRRRKSAKSAGKGIAVLGALAAGTIGIVALARAGSATGPVRK